MASVVAGTMFELLSASGTFLTCGLLEKLMRVAVQRDNQKRSTPKV